MFLVFEEMFDSTEQEWGSRSTSCRTQGEQEWESRSSVELRYGPWAPQPRFELETSPNPVVTPRSSGSRLAVQPNGELG